MADVKKPAGKPAARPAPSPAVAEMEYVFFGLVAAAVIFIVIPAVVKFFGYGDIQYGVPDNLGEQSAHVFSTVVETVSSISIFICLLLIMGIVYSKFKHKEVTEAFSLAQSGAVKDRQTVTLDPSQFKLSLIHI